MRIEVKTQLKAKDIYRFNMFHTYTTFNGYLSMILSAFITVILVLKWDSIDTVYKALYMLVILIGIVYSPVVFAFKADKLAKTSILGKTLRYSFSEDAIEVAAEDDQVEGDSRLEYSQIYSVRQSKHNLLVYSSRVNAFIIPLENISDDYDKLASLLRDNVEDFKLCNKIKKV